ncbi:hypothetical protein B0H14DRAFT_2284041, partial [Mycena olivaceomarginata]
SLSGPIWRVPAEIVVEIFAHTRPTQRLQVWWTRESAKSYITQTYLLTVSQVCRRWRNVATDTPALWNRIHISGGFSPQEMIRFYALVLERGRNSPLDPVVVKGGSNCRSVFRLLATHSERWKTADIQCDMSDLRYFTAAQGKLPFLETLVLYSWDEGPEV